MDQDPMDDVVAEKDVPTEPVYKPAVIPEDPMFGKDQEKDESLKKVIRSAYKALDDTTRSAPERIEVAQTILRKSMMGG